MILAIDTTGRNCGVALWDNDLVAHRLIASELRHSEILLNVVDKLLEENNVKSSSIKAIAVSSGPGSFTGLRVGMAAAKGLCYSWQIKFIAIPTLDALAESVPTQAKSVLTLMPARALEVHWALFKWSDNSWKRLSDNQIDDISGLAAKFEGEVFPVGEGYLKHKTTIDSVFENRLLVLPEDCKVSPLCVSTARLASQKIRMGQYSDLMNAEPEYCFKFPS